MTYPNCPVPPWTPAMQALWNSAMFIERTRGAYGVGFPQPGATYPPPVAGTFLHTILFVATAAPEEVEAHLLAVRENMEGWKARVRASRGKSKLSVVRDSGPVTLTSVDLTKVEFKL